MLCYAMPCYEYLLDEWWKARRVPRKAQVPQPPSLDLRHFRSPLANIPGLVEMDEDA